MGRCRLIRVLLCTPKRAVDPHVSKLKPSACALPDSGFIGPYLTTRLLRSSVVWVPGSSIRRHLCLTFVHMFTEYDAEIWHVMSRQCGA